MKLYNKTIDNFITILDIRRKSDTDNNLLVTVRLDRVISRTLFGFKLKPISESRKVEFFSRGKGGYFHFYDWDCPECRRVLDYDQGWALLLTTPSEKYPFAGVSRNQLRSLIDKYWAKHGIVAQGNWPE